MVWFQKSLHGHGARRQDFVFIEGNAATEAAGQPEWMVGSSVRRRADMRAVARRFADGKRNAAQDLAARKFRKLQLGGFRQQRRQAIIGRGFGVLAFGRETQV
ncbi:MAG: hypothetical protein HOQ41_24615 [Ensifer adhaerens]|nr:hypothetical protein [Ensifer adhaerens]